MAQDHILVIREYDPKKDLEMVETLEHMCQVGPAGEVGLFEHLLGDPLARIRHSPTSRMLVAETSTPPCEIVGVVRGSVKTVSCGEKPPINATKEGTLVPVYAKVAYLLGLRVSPRHRRRGVATKLVQHMEQWFRDMGAEYAYMATEKGNEASVRLFTGRCGYAEFRTPAILVHPVFAHPMRVPRRVTVARLTPRQAEAAYRRRFACTEFFPRDIDAVLRSRLSLGTFVASAASDWAGAEEFLAEPPASWAMLSVWDCTDVYRLEVRGVPRWRRALAGVSRAADRAFPWLRVPSVPDIFRPFGFYFMYGIDGQGPRSRELARALCRHAHDMAREAGCAVVAAEVAAGDPLYGGVLHWGWLSCPEDLWCVKRLAEGYSEGALGDWTKAPPGRSIFVDPREI